MTEDDHAVLRRSRDDPAAFGLLFDRHFTAIHRFVRHRLGEAAADELAAEVFLRAYAARERYEPRSADARAWLFAIATNLIRDEVRRRARADAAETRLAGERPAAPCIQPSGDDPELTAALLSLREEEREALLLLAWADLTYEEIADATGVAIGTVRSRISRARSRLQLELAASPYAPEVPHDRA